MTTTVVEDVAPITEYGLTISVVFSAATWAAYSLGSGRVVAQFRVHPASSTLIYEADSDDGTITRSGSYTLNVKVTDAAGESFVQYPFIYFDFVHIDGTTYTAVPGRIKWPCALVVTKKASIS